MKRTISRIFLGLVATVAIMAILFAVFYFINPLAIYQANQLKWIPLLIVSVGIFASGKINATTPLKWLPILCLPIILLKPFHFFYFPFILIALAMAALMLFASRSNQKYQNLAWGAAGAVFLFFLFSQPLILLGEDYDYDENGELINVTTLWDFESKAPVSLPNHELAMLDDGPFNLSSLKGKTYFLSFWATWCGPCLETKPELEQLKEALSEASNLQLIDVSFDTNDQIWKDYLTEEQPSGLQLYAPNRQHTSRALEFAGLPMYVIVDEKGNYKKYRSFAVAEGQIRRKF